LFTFKNCTYLSDSWELKQGDVSFEADRIVSGIPGKGGEEIDLGRNILIPGYMDIHIHGANGIDVMTASVDELVTLAEFLPTFGVTSFFPTTVADTTENIVKAIKNVKEAQAKNKKGAAIAGIHIEGPFVNPKRKGAFDITKLRNPDIQEYDQFREAAEGMKIRMTAAPELPGSLELIHHVTETGGSVTLGHTDATQAQAMEGLKNGANCFTHLFNAMRGLYQREPGAAGAALLGDSYMEIICDGMHVHPDMVKLAFKVKDHEKIAMITDAVLAMGLGDGKYIFCGKKILVQDGLVREEDGTIAGSTLTMEKAVINVMKFTGLDLEHTVKSSSLIPARVTGLDHLTGSITAGKIADFAVLDEDHHVVQTYCRGKLAYQRG